MQILGMESSPSAVSTEKVRENWVFRTNFKSVHVALGCGCGLDAPTQA